ALRSCLRYVRAFSLRDVFHFERSTADMQVALWIWDLDADSGEMLVDQVIQIASEPARSVSHFAAPGNELKIDGAITKLLQKRRRLRILQSGWMLPCCGDQRLTHFVHIAAISHADRKTKPHTRIAILPVGHRRIDEFRIGHNDGDIVVGHNHSTSRTDLPNGAEDACYFDAISNRDRSFRQDDQAADEIAGDVLQAKSDTDAKRTSKNRECGEMDPSVFQNEENADDQHDVADDLGDGVLQRPIEPALREKPVEKKTFRS